MLASLLAYQLARQADKGAMVFATDLARRLAALTLSQTGKRLGWLQNFMTVAEFLARETRAGEPA